MKPEVKWLMNYMDERPMLDDMQTAIDAATEWLYADHGYESKNARIKEWDQSSEDVFFYDIFCHIMAGVMLNQTGEMTYQAMIGYIAGNVGCAAPLDRAKCAAELIAIAYQSGLIVITKVSDTTFMITTEYVLSEDVPSYLAHAPSFQKLKPVDHIPILGNRFKKHDQDVCRDHIDTMNAIPLCLEFRVISQLEETTKAELITQEQIDQWEDFKLRSDAMYLETDAQGNEFYLEHNMDTRGRCYCSGYYINYQGASYKKAIVQLANKEVVKL